MDLIPLALQPYFVPVVLIIVGLYLLVEPQGEAPAAGGGIASPGGHRDRAEHPRARRSHPTRPALANRQRATAFDRREARAPESRRLREGPDRPSHDRGRRAP